MEALKNKKSPVAGRPKDQRPVTSRPVTYLALALALDLSAGGCVLVPRPDPIAEDVFRNAAGDPVVVPWEWAK